MLKIRLARTGKKNQSNFRIVVTEDAAPPKSGYFAVIGHYEPKHKKIVINKEAATSWMAKGALPSEKAAVLMKKSGLSNEKIDQQVMTRKMKIKKQMERKLESKKVEDKQVVKKTATEDQ